MRVSPTDLIWTGPKTYYGSGKSGTGDCNPVTGAREWPNCPICGGEFGHHKTEQCSHKLEIELRAKEDYMAMIAAAVEHRGWLLGDDHDSGKWTYEATGWTKLDSSSR